MHSLTTLSIKAPLFSHIILFSHTVLYGDLTFTNFWYSKCFTCFNSLFSVYIPPQLHAKRNDYKVISLHFIALLPVTEAVGPFKIYLLDKLREGVALRMKRRNCQRRLPVLQYVKLDGWQFIHWWNTQWESWAGGWENNKFFLVLEFEIPLRCPNRACTLS